MDIVTGTNVDLIAPFPAGQARRVYNWNFCFRTFAENDDVPQNPEEFTSRVESLLAVCPTFGVVDKGQITSTRHEAPLVGLVMFEPAGQRHGFIHFACGRKAFKMGLMDEAVEMAVRWLFTNVPGLLRVGTYLDESNTPAKWLFRRLGFRYEGICRDVMLRGGMLRDLVYFGLPRREWESTNEVPVDDNATVAADPHTDTSTWPTVGNAIGDVPVAPGDTSADEPIHTGSVQVDLDDDGSPVVDPVGR